MNEICQLLKIKYPLIQGGMANITDGKFAATVSNAGALGIIASGGNDAEWVRGQIKIAKSLTSNPFGVNIIMLSPHAPSIAQVIIDEKVAVVTTGAGNPSSYIPAWKEAGIIVIPVVPNVALARRMANNGADVIICEGTESGGHIGETTTFTLVPQVVDALEIPVIAAGGIGDARGVKAAMALGAKGIQAGTIFLATNECPIHINFKERIVSAKDTDTVVTGRENKMPVRVLKTPMALQYLKMEKSHLPLIELEKLTLGSLKKAVIDGDIEHGSFMAGQVAGLIKTIKPVGDVVKALFEGVDF